MNNVGKLEIAGPFHEQRKKKIRKGGDCVAGNLTEGRLK